MRLLLLLTLLFPATLRAEDQPTFSLGEMVCTSTAIFSARPLNEPGMVWNSPRYHYSIHRFVVTEILLQDTLTLPDTILVCLNDYCISVADYPVFLFYGQYIPGSYTDTSALFIPTSSGIRPFNENSAFIPFQWENPGCYHLLEKSGTSLQDWVAHTYRALVRFQALRALRQIQPAAAQNQALFAWIEQNRQCWQPDTTQNNFRQYDPYSTGFIPTTGRSDTTQNDPGECDWGDYRWQVFQWINGNGLWQDAWKSMLLSEALMPQYGMVSTRPPDTPNPFSTEEARAFLITRITAADHAALALQTLAQAVWSWDEDPPPVPEAERTKIMALALPLLEQEANKYSVLYLIRAAALYPGTLKWQDSPGVSPLAALKKVHSSQDEYFNSVVKELIGELERK